MVEQNSIDQPGEVLKLRQVVTMNTEEETSSQSWRGR